MWGGWDFLAKYVFVFFSGLLVTWLLTPAVAKVARSLGMLDIPDERRIHTRPVPRGGGVAVFLGFHAACAATFLMPWPAFIGELNPVWWWRCLVLSTLLLALGLADDRKGLRPLVKLAGQTAVAALAFVLDMRVAKILGFALPPVLDLVVTVLWFLAIINAFNLIDGLDGLATGLGVIAALGLAGSAVFRRAPADTLVVLGLAGACLAFLRYNFHPAQIFLGDSGSMFLGFVLAAVPVSTAAKGAGITAVVLPLLAVGVPLFDTLLAVWRRTARRLLGRQGAAEGQLFHADLDHLHHRLVRAGLSQSQTAVWLYVLGLGLVVVGLLSMLYHSYAHGIYLLAFVAVTYVSVRHLARVELWDTGRLIVEGLRRPPARAVLYLLHPVGDVAMLMVALGVAVHFTAPELPARELKLLWFQQVILWVGIPFLFLVAAGTYNRVWSRARAAELVLLALTILAGVASATGLAVLIERWPRALPYAVVDFAPLADVTVVLGRAVPGGFAVQTLLYGSLAVVAVVGLRLVPRVVRDAMAWVQRHAATAAPEARATLVYGAGDRSLLFLREYALAPATEQARRRIVGLLDEDPNLHGRWVYGYRVRGGLAHLERILTSESVAEIVVTEPLPPDKLTQLATVAGSCGVAVVQWRTVTTPLELGATPRNGDVPHP